MALITARPAGSLSTMMAMPACNRKAGITTRRRIARRLLENRTAMAMNDGNAGKTDQDGHVICFVPLARPDKGAESVRIPALRRAAIRQRRTASPDGVTQPSNQWPLRVITMR